MESILPHLNNLTSEESNQLLSIISQRVKTDSDEKKRSSIREKVLTNGYCFNEEKCTIEGISRLSLRYVIDVYERKCCNQKHISSDWYCLPIWCQVYLNENDNDGGSDTFPEFLITTVCFCPSGRKEDVLFEQDKPMKVYLYYAEGDSKINFYYFNDIYTYKIQNKGLVEN
jgi:hypothetical protein